MKPLARIAYLITAINGVIAVLVVHYVVFVHPMQNIEPDAWGDVTFFTVRLAFLILAVPFVLLWLLKAWMHFINRVFR